ncbi:hypothetical protein ACWEF9_29925 [Streptomyces sp. NPDC004980]
MPPRMLNWALRPASKAADTTIAHEPHIPPGSAEKNLNAYSASCSWA